MVLVMTVEPGFGGQGFISETLEKVKIIREAASKNNLTIDIEVDGGINATTAPLANEAGANVLVSGSYLFNAADMALAMETLRF